MAYQNLTLAQIRALVVNRIQNPNFFEANQINDAINESLRIWNLGVGFWKQRFVLTTVAKRCIYDLTDPTLTQIVEGGVPQIEMPLRVTFNSLPMDPTSIFDMDNGFPGWQAQTTTSSGVPNTPAAWGPIGCNKFFIWPADNAGNNGLKIDALVRAPVLTADGQYIDIDSSEVTVILDYINHVLFFSRGGAPFKATMPKLANFLRAIGMRNAHLRAAGIFRGHMGDDASRRQRPRRVPEFPLGRTTMGVR